MDNSKINQTELDYSSKSGTAKVNLYTGRLIYAYGDASIGLESYEISLSHIYNSKLELPSGINTYLGNKWKLNIQQYLYKSGDKYYMIDAGGSEVEFELLEDGTYFDKTGLGMKLVELNNQVEVYDMANNKMVFENNRLIKTISCENISIVKRFIYTGDKLTSIYDERTPDTKIQFNYYDSKLDNILVIVKNKVQYKLKYYYKSSKLMRISKIIDEIEKPLVYYNYLNSDLQYAVISKLGLGFKFGYSNGKVISVKNGVATFREDYTTNLDSYLEENVYLDDDKYVGDKEKKYYYEVSSGMNTFGTDVSSYNNISYNIGTSSKFTVVTNEKGVRMMYFFNESGYTTSIMESVYNENDNLKTLTVMPGVDMIDINSISDEYIDSESINDKNVLLLTTGTNISSVLGGILTTSINDLDYYRGNKCPHYVNFICSFWLKLLEPVSNPNVELCLTPQDSHTAYVGKASFDNSAIGVWQEVRIPITIDARSIGYAELNFKQTGSVPLKLGEMKMYYSSISNIGFGTENDLTYLDDLYKIQYKDLNNETNDIILTNIGIDSESNIFISEKDLQMSYVSYFRANHNNNTTNPFRFYYNDGTNCVIAKNVQLMTKSYRLLDFEFENDIYNVEFGKSNTLTKLIIESISPDGNLYTYQKSHYLKNYSIDGVTYDCMCNITEGNKYKEIGVDGEPTEAHKESNMQTYLTFSGKKLKTVDEYGVVKLLKYDTFGVQKSVIFTSIGNPTERITTSKTSTLDTSTNKDRLYEVEEENEFTTNKYYFDKLSNIYKSEYKAKSNQTLQTLVNEIEYNNFNNYPEHQSNNLDSTEFVNYDDFGRLLRVSPKDYNASDYYGYRFEYDVFSNPIQLYYQYREGNVVKEKLLFEEEIDLVNGKVIKKDYRNSSSPDIVESTMDKYGDLINVKIGNKNVTYTKSSLSASDGAAKVEKIYDEFDGKTYNFIYDDFNNLIQYDVESTEEGSLLFKKSSEDTILCEEAHKTIFDFDSKMKIKYDENVYLKPRINETSNQYYSNNNPYITTYQYDHLGRINYKYEHHVYQDNYFNRVEVSKNFVSKTNLVNELSYEYSSYTGNVYKSKNYKFNNLHNELGLIKETSYSSDNTLIYKSKYKYNSSSQLIEESNKDDSIKVEYSYNNDGSIDYEKLNGIPKNYNYTNGRLSSITESGLTLIQLTYDNLGNVVQEGSNSLTWHRGNLLSSYSNDYLMINYYFNGLNQKYKKTVLTGETYYYKYDNDKLISQYWSNGYMRFTYDVEGITGFWYKQGIDEGYYQYVKDISGNIIAITLKGEEVARYEYDAFGKCTITYSSNNTIANINPFRWKGMYCEVENGLYFIENNTYDPSIRQYLNMKTMNDIMNSSSQLNNLYPYQFTPTNPVNLIVNENNIETRLNLTYVPKDVSVWKRNWDEFWKTDLGKVIAIGLTVVCFVLSVFTGTVGVFIGACVSVVLTLGIGGLIAGIQSKKTGKGFYNGFKNYINENWSQTLGVEMAIAIVTIGISKVVNLMIDCFIAGTLVATGYGLTKIEDIKVGDKVWSYNEKTKQKELKTVKNIFRNKTKSWMHIFVYNKETDKEEEIICTPSHRIYIVNKGWIEAKNILENDKVLLYNNNIGLISKIYKEELAEEQTTYNFEVEHNHNYYVGEEYVLVHNKCTGSYDIEFESGRHYVGKGSEKRMHRSTKRIEKKFGDSMVKQTYVSAPNDQVAFVREYMTMAKYNFDFTTNTHKGILYNRINSPGRKLFELWF